MTDLQLMVMIHIQTDHQQSKLVKLLKKLGKEAIVEVAKEVSISKTVYHRYSIETTAQQLVSKGSHGQKGKTRAVK